MVVFRSHNMTKTAATRAKSEVLEYGVWGWRDTPLLSKRGFMLTSLLTLTWRQQIYLPRYLYLYYIFIQIQYNCIFILCLMVWSKSFSTDHSLFLHCSMTQRLPDRVWGRDREINQLPSLLTVIGSYSFWVYRMVLKGERLPVSLIFFVASDI